MRKFSWWLTLAMMTLHMPVVALADQTVIPEGTEVTLKSLARVTSKTAKDGDTVPLLLSKDIVIHGVALVKAGAKGWAIVTHAKPGKWAGRPGELSLRLESLKAGSTSIRLRGNENQVGTHSTAANAALVVGTLGIGLIHHGHNVELEVGTEFTAYTAEDATL